MDRDHAPTYDEQYGNISSTHGDFVGRLLALTRQAGTLLDAACGTGKYWPLVLASGRTVIGIDQSAGMLAQAAAKHPQVPVGRIGLQELAFEGLFDAVGCIDALENVAPEDWPGVACRLAAAARRNAPLYVTVELAAADDVWAAYEAARAAGQPVVLGEVFDGVGYHFYPTREAVGEWLAGAGLELLDEATDDDYLHLLLRRQGSER